MTPEDRVNRIVRNMLPANTDILPHHELVDDLGADSLDFIEIVMACEEEFDLKVSDHAMERIVTVGDLQKHFKRNSNG